jgi:hypothetical protein
VGELDALTERMNGDSVAKDRSEATFARRVERVLEHPPEDP